jgi:hypothetical protein
MDCGPLSAEIPLGGAASALVRNQRVGTKQIHESGGGTVMKKLGLFLGATALLGVSLVLVQVQAAEAHTCRSVCSQVRRACRSVGKAVRKVDNALCDDDRDGCKTDCETNADTCVDDCTAACEAACAGDTDCEALCPDACVEECADCEITCNADRVVCRDSAKAKRGAWNLFCDDARSSCGDTCMDPIDSVCVRGCKADRKGCARLEKIEEKKCKKECPRGTGRRACMRKCRRELNERLQVCSNTEIGCLAGCAGVAVPTPPPAAD